MYVPEIDAGQPYIAKHMLKDSETIYVLNCLSRARSQLKKTLILDSSAELSYLEKQISRQDLIKCLLALERHKD